MSEEKPFSSPVTIAGGAGTHIVSSVGEALDFLTTEWPGEHGTLHAEAVETCHKVLDGHRSTSDARHALVRAAREEGILADQFPEERRNVQ